MPLRLHVICDDAGLHAFNDVYEEHVVQSGVLDDDVVPRPPPPHMINMDGRDFPERAVAYLRGLHPSCHLRDYGYLFLKILAPELLPAAEKLIVLDPDTVVLGDLAELWAEFDAFSQGQLLSMAVDQSDRYYYRLQNEQDAAHSPGWKGVPHGVGVNGGVLLLHAAKARAVEFADVLSELTHVGAQQRSEGTLDQFCDLAEQDTLNLALTHRPDLWRPLDCRWNYMATNLGGHALAPDPSRVPLCYYDKCANGVTGSKSAADYPAGDLFQCSCGRKVGLLHFAGGSRANPLLARINETVREASGAALRANARLRSARPEFLGEAGEEDAATVAAVVGASGDVAMSSKEEPGSR